jgi:Arginyl-tRNA synthetase
MGVAPRWAGCCEHAQAVGYDVVSEYYINDAGRQMKLLGASVYARYEELSNRPVEFPSEGYHGAYITAVAERVKQQLGAELTGRPPSEVEERCRTLPIRNC